MPRLHIATQGLVDWKSRLADPELHWKRGRSAFEAAASWELASQTAQGLPTEIADLLNQQGELSNATLLLAVAEHKVELPHGKRASQNDVWALIRAKGGLLSLAVEAKAGEEFDATVEQWLAKREQGSKKPERLAYLTDVLGIRDDVGRLRYQLLHRAASAILEARRVGAGYAAVIVQCFKNPELLDRQREQWEDFQRFGRVLGAKFDTPDTLRCATTAVSVPLFLGWADCDVVTDKRLDTLSKAPAAEPALIDRSLGSKAQPVREAQARFFAMCIANLKDGLRRAGLDARRGVGWDDMPRLLQLPEYQIFVQSGYVCGFVCGDFDFDAATYPLREIHENPTQALSRGSFKKLRHYVHTLLRAERWADGMSSPVVEALACGALDIVESRLNNDESLYKPY